MEFQFQQTTSREVLLGLPLQHKITYLQNIADRPSSAILGHALQGHTSYLWEIDEAKVVQWRHDHDLTLIEIIAAFSARYPGCKVEWAEEWVEHINFRGVQTRTPKSGIKIDWS